MYRSHYNLKEKPFQISTDPKFLWLGEKHQEALAILKYGIMDNRGFLLLTGDVGTGKTTLIHALCRSLGNNVTIATVPDPGLEILDFLNYVAYAFGLNGSFESKGAFLLKFSDFLHDAHRNNKKALLIIDEAQRLNPELIEEIRLLSNIEKHDVKLLNIFFVGQNEFSDFLLDPENRASRQRITINFNLDPLTESETGKYIAHRLEIAGASKNMFTSGAIKEIHKFSAGYPRLINIICDHALLTGYVEEKRTIRSKIITECATELEIPTREKERIVEKKEYTPEINNASPVTPVSKITIPERWPKRYLGYAGAVLLLLIAAGYLYSTIGYTQYKEPENVTEPAIGVEMPSPINTQMLNPKLPDPEMGPNKEEDLPAITGRYVFLYYGHNSNELSDEAFGLLDRLASTTNRNPNIKLDIRGYTDTSGSVVYNKKLSAFRANIVKSYLLGKGLNRSRISTMGMGSEDSLAPEDVKSALKSARRVEIELVTNEPEPSRMNR